MGFGEMRLIAASTPGAPAADPASTTTMPSSPTCTPTLAPAPAMTKNEGRTSRTSRLFDGAFAVCGAAAFSAADAATTAASRLNRRHLGNAFVIFTARGRRLAHNQRAGRAGAAAAGARLSTSTLPSFITTLALSIV